MDAEYFDEFGILQRHELPPVGERAVLASFEVHPQYCAVLSWFAQFTDLYALDNSKVLTPGLRWQLLRNGQPLFPYHDFEGIINPWGYGGFGVAIRLDQNARLEFAIHNRGCDYDELELGEIGGRILGRYWYDSDYGGERRTESG